MALGGGSKFVGAHCYAPLPLNPHWPGPRGFPVPARQLRAKATMCLEIKRYAHEVPIRTPIKSVSDQGFGELKKRDLVESMTAMTSGINKMKLLLRIPMAILGPTKGLRAKPRCLLKSTDARITVPSPRPNEKHVPSGFGEPKITGPG